MVDNFAFENAYAGYSFQDGILYIEFKTEQIIDLDIMKIVVEDRITISSKSVVPAMIIIKDDFLILEKDAVEYLTSDAGTEKAAAQAVVLSSLPLRLKFNLARSRGKGTPKRAFKRRSAAKLWLMEYLNHEFE